MPDAVLDQTVKTLAVISQLSLVFYFAPWVAIVLPLLLGPYWLIYSTVRIAARDTRRIEATAHSPCYSHFSDTLTGRGTIKAFGAQSRFTNKNAYLVRGMSTAKVRDAPLIQHHDHL